MLDDAPWPPREEPEEPEGGGEHLWRHDRDECAKCGISGQALLSFPGTPCNPVAARQANDALRAAQSRVRDRGRYRRGKF